jgi:hypothetical protein
VLSTKGIDLWEEIYNENQEDKNQENWLANNSTIMIRSNLHYNFYQRNRHAMPPCTRDATSAAVLGGSAVRSLADRLAVTESGS